MDDVVSSSGTFGIPSSPSSVARDISETMKDGI